MHSCSNCKHAHCKLLNDDRLMMIKYFAFLSHGPGLTYGTHINEEQNQNHGMSTGYKPGTSHMHLVLLAIEKNKITL